ncbi:MAG: ribosome silencing factor [Clostridia bacterium]|nr:ribosome silencing factor [Clostridia bacterium]
MDETTARPEWATLPALDGADPRALAEAVAFVLDEKKGHEIKTLHVEDKTVLADYFVLCTGYSNTQVNALADEVDFKIGQRGLSPLHYEGRDNGSWVLIDYGSVIVHIFSREARDFYNLDKLWSDAVPVDLGEQN